MDSGVLNCKLIDYDVSFCFNYTLLKIQVAILIRSGLMTSKQICPSESVGCYDASLCDFEKLLKEAKNEVNISFFF